MLHILMRTFGHSRELSLRQQTAAHISYQNVQLRYLLAGFAPQMQLLDEGSSVQPHYQLDGRLGELGGLPAQPVYYVVVQLERVLEVAG